MINAIRSGDTVNLILYFISAAIVVFISMPIHEFAHAFTAVKLGDPTPKYSGRNTINPFAHLDPIGSLLILLFGFGWAKPVPVNSFNFKNPKRDMAITAAAGPISNIIIGFVFYIILSLLQRFAPATEIMFYIILVCTFVVRINVGLAVFNLIPVPPLDGSRLLSAFLNDRNYYKLMQYERYFSLGIMLLILTGALDVPISYLQSAIYKLFDLLTFWI